MWRKGIDYMKPPTWEEVAKQKVCMRYANTKKRFYKGEIYAENLRLDKKVVILAGEGGEEMNQVESFRED